jgi:hypothetical protein
LCLCKRMYSVSFFSNCFRMLFCSSSDTLASASFFSKLYRLHYERKKTQVKICALKLNSGKQRKMPSRAKSIYEHIMLYSWTYHFPSDLVSTKFSGTYHCPSDLIEDYLDEWKWHTKGLTNHNDHSGCGKTLYLIDKPMTIA